MQVAVFLNKLLGLRLEEQGKLFDYFSEIHSAIVRFHQSRGEFE